MKPHSSKLQHGQKEETVPAEAAQQQRAAAQEFSTPEEMLRADAAHTEVPAAVRTRLAESVRKEAPPAKPRSWWKRLMD